MHIPHGIADVTPEWLTQALARPGAVVEKVEVIESHEVTNAHARIGLSYAEGDGPTSLFCKLPPTNADHHRAVGALAMGTKEALFYGQLAPTLRVLSPHAVATAHDDERFVLLLDDLVPAQCQVSDGTWGIPPDAAAVALEDLASLHVPFADPAYRAAHAPWVTVSRPTQEYGRIHLEGALRDHRDRLSPAYAEIAQLYLTQHDQLQEAWHLGPHTVIHGDPHIGNLYLDPRARSGGLEARVGFLDWGIINLNTPMRDVGYFLTMALSIDDRRRHERDLLRHYVDVRRASGLDDISYDDAWLAHRVHASYTVPASCAAANYSGTSERRRIFAKAFVERAVAALDDLEARAALRDVVGV
jgi:hypothetical protein